MSHLEKDILKNKFGKNPKLKKEAREELAEEKIEKKTGKHVKVREMAGKMKVRPGLKNFRKYYINPNADSYSVKQGRFPVVAYNKRKR